MQKDTAAKIFAAVNQLLLKSAQTLQQEAFERGLPGWREREYSGNFDFDGAPPTALSARSWPSNAADICSAPFRSFLKLPSYLHRRSKHRLDSLERRLCSKSRASNSNLEIITKLKEAADGNGFQAIV